MSNFRTFSVSTTNIFPAANSKAGGQLMSEFNLRSRESVGVGPASEDGYIDYFVGPSYTHSMADFNLTIQTDEVGHIMSNSVIQISEGKAVINGHYVESLAPMIVDLTKANAESATPLKGALTIGFRVMYSGESTVAGTISKTYGSILAESDEVYNGIQTVILPSNQFILPEDSPKDKSKVTAHLKLGTFYFTNGKIKNIQINKDKCKLLSAERIKDINRFLAQGYMPCPNIDPNRFYVLSGKRQSGQSAESEPTWCEAQDSLMVWDADPSVTSTPPTVRQACFNVNSNNAVVLNVPHKQIDGSSRYFESRTIPLPVADYTMGTSGTVSPSYTANIKKISEKVKNLYEGVDTGELRRVVDFLDASRSQMPELNPAWKLGDYVLVCQDGSVVSEGSGSYPSTMYVVSPGQVTEIIYTSSKPEGCQLAISEGSGPAENKPNTTTASEYSAYWNITAYNGIAGKDYFTYAYTVTGSTTPTYYYYKVKTVGANVYSQPVFLTGQIPLASESAVGGFLNCSESDIDGGYVWLDETGHLRLLDYGLLRTGTLAYQLGQDMESDTTLTIEGLQDWLDQNVNDRVVFPNSYQSANSTSPNVINITITVPKLEDTTEVNNLFIRGLDSRFGASVYLHILGSGTSNTIIHLVDCQKIRVDSTVTVDTHEVSNPQITITRCGLYYDPAVLDYLSSISDLSLWYEQMEDTDSDIFVNGLTVRLGSSENISVEDIDFWTDEVDNDNHISYALCGITFDRSGTIIGADIFIKNSISEDTDTSQAYIAIQPFNLPQSSALMYPESRLKHPIKITGSFVNGYKGTDTYVLYQVNFSAVSGKQTEGVMSQGTISMLIQRYNLLATPVVGDLTTAGWDVESSHMFSGWIEK